ncbi:hypothetical protein [Ruegeria sp. 6PALISEP08]|uniref:hypothetical protein n=1 Tax=Ruegeria sp. 6PALISEP08 TaxID=1225660 RepID=UPI00067EBBE3|nr:hypothetical protein [Ruegeria sp. 6PALISEP08]
MAQSDRTSKRVAFGRVLTAGGGGPNQPVVVICSSSVWTADGQSKDGYAWTLHPATLVPHWCVVRDGDARTIREIVDADLETWRESRNPSAPAVVLSDVGQNLAASDLLTSRSGWEDPTTFANVLVNGSTCDGTEYDVHGRQIIGARFLVSWFDRMLWKNPKHVAPPLGAFGAPWVQDRIILAFDANEYSVPNGGLTWEAVGRGAASAEALTRRPGIGDADALAGLSADETVAIALMLQFWAAYNHAPVSNSGPIHYRAPHLVL